RAEVRLEETPRSRSLIVTEIPPIGRDKVKASIVKAINARKLEGLLPDVRDESDTEKGMRIVLELRKDADAAQVLSQLFNETDLQIALSFQIVFLFGEPMQMARQPKQVGLIELLNYWNAHQVDVLTRRAQFDLRKAQERLHVVEGLIALLKKEMQQLIKQFGDERRTAIDVEGQIHEPIKEVASLYERESLVLAFTRAGALKALPVDTFVPRGKNGAAVYTPVRGDE